jgi:cytoskeletal protein CcmA (bactofilin family)
VATLPPAESTDQLLFSSSTFFTSNGAAWIALSGGSVLPLSRTLFVDGGTSAISHDGSIAAPYLTISAALAVFGQPVSTEDADTVVQAWIASALGGYTAEPGTVIPIPAYRQVWVQGISQEAGLVTTLGTLGPSTTATLTWANTAANGGANPPAEVSSLVVYSLQVPAITVTDDGTSPEIIILDQAHVSGAIDASGATAFGEVVLLGESAVAGGINTPTGAVIVLGTSTVTGAITASQLEVSGGSVSAGVFTIASTIELSNGADFNPGANPFTCANFSATNATIEGATGTVSGDVNGSYSDFVSGALHSATMEFAYCSFGPGIAFVATGAVTANGCQFDSGTLTCASMSMLNCTFGFPDVGFQITATTITTDFESWQSYIGQGGLPNGATVTIIDRAPPLSRTMFVDGGSTGVDPSGQVLAPFHTISAGIAPFATQPVSTEDADSTVQVWVTPVLGGYESEPGSVINIPAYRQVVIQGTSEHSQFFGVAGIVGTSTNATLTWANTAANGGANPPTALTTLIISWMGVEGITITDDASSPEFLFLEGVFLPNIGTIDGTGATDLEAIFLDNECTVVGTIDAPSAGVVIQGSSVVEGSITAASVECNLCEVSGALALNATAGNIEFNSGANINDVTYNSETFSATGALVTGSTGTVTGDSEITTTQFIDGTLKSATATITNCTFSAGFQLTITDTLSIDAESWVNYLAQGGSPGTVNTFSIIGQTAKGYVTSPFPQNLTITPGLPDQFIAAFNLTPTQTGNLDVAGTFLVQPTTPDTPEYVILVYVGTATGGTPSGPNCLLGSDTAQIAPPAGTPTPVMAFEPLPTTAASEDNLSVTIAALVTGLDLGTQYAIVIGCASPGGAVWTYSANVRVFENPVN